MNKPYARKGFKKEINYDFSDGYDTRIIKTKPYKEDGDRLLIPVEIIRNEIGECRSELSGQITDGMFEDYPYIGRDILEEDDSFEMQKPFHYCIMRSAVSKKDGSNIVGVDYKGNILQVLRQNLGEYAKKIGLTEIPYEELFPIESARTYGEPKYAFQDFVMTELKHNCSVYEREDKLLALDVDFPNLLLEKEVPLVEQFAKAYGYKVCSMSFGEPKMVKWFRTRRYETTVCFFFMPLN